MMTIKVHFDSETRKMLEVTVMTMRKMSSPRPRPRQRKMKRLRMQQIFFSTKRKRRRRRRERDKKETKQDDGTVRIFDGIVGSDSEFFGGMYANRGENFVEISIEIEPERQKLHLIDPVLETCEKVDVLSTDGIKKVHVLTRSSAENNEPYLHCEGVNMKRVWSLHGGVVDTNKLKTNDIGVILHHYGVEACRAHIVEQVASVFGVYGIKTDERHLGLVADYMTQCGGFRPMNRLGMDSSASPLLQMSFETTTRFLTQAASTKTTEMLESPLLVFPSVSPSRQVLVCLICFNLWVFSRGSVGVVC